MMGPGNLALGILSKLMSLNAFTPPNEQACCRGEGRV